MDLGDWSIRNWKTLASLTTAVFVAAGALVGYASNYTGRSRRSAARTGSSTTSR